MVLLHASQRNVVAVEFGATFACLLPSSVPSGAFRFLDSVGLVSVGLVSAGLVSAGLVAFVASIFFGACF